MEFIAPYIGRYVRAIALISLLLGLNDAARLLGVYNSSNSPILMMGVDAFVLLAIFAVSRLFAAVGLWIGASWGAVLLVGATSAELVLYIVGSEVQMSLFGFVLRLFLLASIIGVFMLGLRTKRAEAGD
ncbi:hypothetical protein GCM10007989_35660 [Devosia pacifica]|uniref:Uncharacterized protein n=1 Tax=Devosia pacifica TaxID=1335967 RepID=A0A918SD34_9HYPH|nr:hypothetical protein [Devosia pacifica]GHA36401.1 hypothetical protein GCM10007989_35660 [Devosia pacifica]